jgi:hypothetical protein
MPIDRGTTHAQGGQVEDLARMLLDLCIQGTVLFPAWFLF